MARKVIDTHVHLWDPAKLVYPWHDEVPPLNRPFLPADYREHIGKTDVEALVFLECDVRPDLGFEEAAWVSSLAAGEPRIQGIVAYAPLEKGDAARADLEKLTTLPLVRGVRRIYQSEPDLDFCTRPDFIAGVRALADFGLSFDACMNFRYMEATVRMAAACDNVPIILDHICKPNIREREVEPWLGQMKQLAAMPHVVCKMSGVATEADHDNWTVDDLRPHILGAVEAFGFDRLVFGGDWPVATLAIRYPRWIEVLEEVLSDASEEEKTKLFHDNGKAFYRL